MSSRSAFFVSDVGRAVDEFLSRAQDDHPNSQVRFVEAVIQNLENELKELKRERKTCFECGGCGLIDEGDGSIACHKCVGTGEY